MRSLLKPPYLVAALIGAALWQSTALATGRREAWDAREFWVIAYPAGLVASAVIGYVARSGNSWGIGLSLTWAQAAVLAVVARSYAMLPLGLILFGVLALPGVAFAALGAWLRRRSCCGRTIRPRPLQCTK